MKTINKLIVSIFSIIFFMITSIVFIMHYKIDFSCKKYFLYSDELLFIVGVLLFLALIVLGLKIHIKNTKIKYTFLVIFLIGLFITQVIFLHDYYFHPGWDSGIVINTSYKLTFFNDPNYYIPPNYYSIYPNNIFITTTVYQIFKLLKEIYGVYPISTGIYVLVVIQAVISDYTAYLLYKCVSYQTKSRKTGMIALIFYTILIGLSPWISVPYSDMMTLFIPIGILRLYQIQKDSKYPYIYWFMIGMLTVFGYKIKPQAIFIIFAIFIVEVLLLIDKRQFKRYLINMMICILSLGSFYMLYDKAIKPTFLIPLNKDKEFGLTHFMMMGLDDNSGGIFSMDDVNFSESFQTPEARKDGNIIEIRKRINDLGKRGLLNLYLRKTLTNYADGSFAWGNEGRFIKKQFQDTNQTKREIILRAIYDPAGYYHPYLEVIEHVLWLVLLFLLVISMIMINYQIKPEILISMITILGLTLFETIFEARARYLLTNIPIYIFVGSITMRYLTYFILRKKLPKDRQ